MYLPDILNFIIDDGIEASKASYSEPINYLKLAGSIRGFEDCRNLDLVGLSKLLVEVAHTRYVHQNLPDYWFWRCREAEVEWVCNVLSAIFLTNHLPVLISPTLRGMLKATEIIGVKEHAHG